MFCIIINQTEANVWLTSVALEKTDLGHVRQQSVTWENILIEHMVNVKTLNGSEHAMLSQVAESIPFLY